MHGVNISTENAVGLGKLAQKFDISLTAHGPYYINLASLEKPKYHASLNRVKNTLIAGHQINATSITFHPAFYQDRPPEKVTAIVEKALLAILTDEKLLAETNNKPPLLSLETTGKPSQWGSLEESLTTADKINQKLGEFKVSACIDFAHLHARSNGEFNTRKEFLSIIDLTEKTLGKEALEKLHMHISGINYTEKGERNHLILEESDLNYKEILQVLKEKNVSGWVVCESPNLEDDAKLMKEYYESL